MRTLIKILMLVATLVFLVVNGLSLFASSKVVQQSTAENDSTLSSQFVNAKTRLDSMVAERSLEERQNPETFEHQWVKKSTGEPDGEANALQVQVTDLARKVGDQSVKTAGAVTGAGIFSGGVLCVSTGIYMIAMLVLGVFYFVFRPNTATIKVRHLN